MGVFDVTGGVDLFPGRVSFLVDMTADAFRPIFLLLNTTCIFST